jgi:uncharacterized protein (DUF1684 family)
MDTPTYPDAILAWRHKMEARLRADEGWLTLAGLHWIKEGPNRFGTDPGSDIVLPPASAPGWVGSFELLGTEVRLQVAPGILVKVDGHPVEQAQLQPDISGSSAKVAVGSLTMIVIQRGARIGIRLWDKNHPARERFGGRQWFPIQEGYRVTARLIPYDPARSISITTILGDTEESPSPGYVVFELDGQPVQLVASSGDADGLFFDFRDATSGISTYPGGRFLTSPPPQDGEVELDFNKAYNPPCAFTPYATCPLPPAGNDLPQRIEAGERYAGAVGP